MTSRLRNLACPQFNAESVSTLETGLGLNIQLKGGTVDLAFQTR